MATECGLNTPQRDERAKRFGQWVMIGSYATYVIIAWFGTDLLASALGYELAVGIFGLISVFVVIGAMRLGERAEWWLAARHRRGGA